MATLELCGYASLSDVRLYYEIYGQGPVILLLHGNGEDLHVFDPMIQFLSGRYRVVALDTRGHGKSGRGSKPLRFETLADDVASVLDVLGIAEAHVVGYSDGGNTGMYLALGYPDKLVSLVLLGANCRPNGMVCRYRILTELGFWGCRAMAKGNKRWRSKAERMELMARHPDLDLPSLARIGVPTLVVAGQRDMIREAHTRAMAKALPRGRLCILPRVDHFGLPSAVTCHEQIGRFLGEIGLK